MLYVKFQSQHFSIYVQKLSYYKNHQILLRIHHTRKGINSFLIVYIWCVASSIKYKGKMSLSVDSKDFSDFSTLLKRKSAGINHRILRWFISVLQSMSCSSHFPKAKIDVCLFRQCRKNPSEHGFYWPYAYTKEA